MTVPVHDVPLVLVIFVLRFITWVNITHSWYNVAVSTCLNVWPSYVDVYGKKCTTKTWNYELMIQSALKTTKITLLKHLNRCGFVAKIICAILIDGFKLFSYKINFCPSYSECLKLCNRQNSEEVNKLVVKQDLLQGLYTFTEINWYWVCSKTHETHFLNKTRTFLTQKSLIFSLSR